MLASKTVDSTCGLDLLDRELLTFIFSHFDTADVARARAVCRGWKAILDSSSVRRDIFTQYWRLSRLQNEPQESSYYLRANLSNFVHKHTCQKCDTLTSIAVHYNVETRELKRMNNLMSDFSLVGRTHIYIPVRNRQQVEGKVGQFILDPIACRHLVLLLEEGSTPVPAAAPPASQALPPSECDGMDRLSSLLGRGLRVSKDTARFYLREAHGDVRTAIALCEDDVDWDVHFGHLMRG